MTHGNRTITILAILGLLLATLDGMARSQSNTPAGTSPRTISISGTVGLADVMLKGFPKPVQTDENGMYSVPVPSGWAGMVTPVKEGYVFEPQNRNYLPLYADYPDQNYRATAIMFTISGDAGLAGVTMNGLPDDVVTNAEGRYKAMAPYGWTGVVTPVKTGYRFEPPSREYPPLRKNYTDQDYPPIMVTLTVSGNVGLPDVIMEGLPGNPVTDSDGSFRAQVDFAWSGTVTPRKEGYSFTPPAKQYTRTMRDQENQNYIARQVEFTLSGNVRLPGVVMQGLPGSPITDAAGSYSVRVPYGWSGIVTPKKEDLSFEPPSRQYSKVMEDQKKQDFVSTRKMVPDFVSDVLVIPTTDMMPEKIAETTEDMRVMLHILQEKLSEPRMILGVLRDYGSFFSEDRTVEAFYLQGAAAVFVVQVDFPYSFAAQRQAEGEPQQEPADPVWERARQKLYSPAGARGLGAGGQTQQMTFEQFKDELLRSLKHAANLRNIEPNEQIILTVVAQNEDAAWSSSTVSGSSYAGGGWVAGGSFRSSSSAFGYGGGAYSNSRARGGVAGRSPAGSLPPGTEPGPATTVLTMQAKKADVDAFAKGELDFEQFRQKVKSFTY